jgi:hypothetical protein
MSCLNGCKDTELRKDGRYCKLANVKLTVGNIKGSYLWCPKLERERPVKSEGEKE